MPHLSNTIDAEVFLKDTLDLRLQFFVSLGAIRKAFRISALGQMIIERGWGNRQDAADWLDPMIAPVIFFELDHRFNGRSSSVPLRGSRRLRR